MSKARSYDMTISAVLMFIALAVLAAVLMWVATR